MEDYIKNKIIDNFLVLEHEPNHPKEWFLDLAKQVSSPVIDNTIHVPEFLGTGYVKQWHLMDDIYISLMDFTLKLPVKSVKKCIKDSLIDNPAEIYPITFYLSESIGKQIINGEHANVGCNANGILLSSPDLTNELCFNANKRGLLLIICLSRKWLYDQMGNQPGYVQKLLTNNTPFFLFEDISTPMNVLINHLIVSVNQKNTPSSIYILAKTLELVSMFFDKINSRSFPINETSLANKDIEAVFKAKSLLVESYALPPTIENITKEVGMNQVKLQKFFKQIFGKSIYQYLIGIRMQEAKKLLETQNFSVSEVGYKVGYSNLSHFTEAFRKEFNMNPKHFLTNCVQDFSV